MVRALVHGFAARLYNIGTLFAVIDELFFLGRRPPVHFARPIKSTIILSHFTRVKKCPHGLNKVKSARA